MHIDLKYILVVTISFLGVSGCQSGGSSSWKWWGAQKDQAVSPSELAGSPYDGVTLPSTQVSPPTVAEGKATPPKKSLATVPPGTPTPHAYSVTGGPPTPSNGKPTYPSTAYPSTPHTYPRSNLPGGLAGTVSAPASSVSQGGSPDSAKQRYPVAGFAGGNPQPRYPSTGFGTTAVASQGSASNPMPASSTYGAAPGIPGQTKQAGFSPGVAPMGPRYSTIAGNSTTTALPAKPTPGAAATPSGAPFQSSAVATSPQAIGPRYAQLPGSPNGSRYDSQPANPQVNATPAPAATTASPVGQPATNNAPLTGQNHSSPSRYPAVSSVLPTPPEAGPTRQVDYTPFQPGSTGRYVPGSDPVVPSMATGEGVSGNNFQPGIPYNPPAEDRP